jgi:4'-phosphopantetheinyl transferase
MLELDLRRIDLWCAFCEGIQDESLLREYGELLSEAERHQQARFHFAHDRHRYLITRALVRTTLSRYAAVSPRDWIFRASSHGRPEICNDGPGAGLISFNLSHSRHFVVLGVTRELPLGVDTEDCGTREPPLEIADRFFAPAEVLELRSLAPSDQLKRFFQYWTLKESYIKARGLGLSIPLHKFSFHFPAAGRVTLATQPSLEDPAERWRFWQFQVSPAHLIAVCVERAPEGVEHAPQGPPQLVLNQVIPLASERTLDRLPLVESPAQG